MSHPNEEDFADDETIGASNQKDDYDDENTLATTNMSEESLSSAEASSVEEENENDYSPPRTQQDAQQELSCQQEVKHGND